MVRICWITLPCSNFTAPQSDRKYTVSHTSSVHKQASTDTRPLQGLHQPWKLNAIPHTNRNLCDLQLIVRFSCGAVPISNITFPFPGPKFSVFKSIFIFSRVRTSETAWHPCFTMLYTHLTTKIRFMNFIAPDIVLSRIWLLRGKWSTEKMEPSEMTSHPKQYDLYSRGSSIVYLDLEKFHCQHLYRPEKGHFLTSILLPAPSRWAKIDDC